MKNSDIALVMGISKSTVSKILHGHKNYSDYNIKKVLYYKDFDLKVEKIFSEKIFIKMCDLIIDKAKPKDCKNISSLKRFAVQCKIWGKTLQEGNKEFQGVPSLTIRPIDLFISDDMLTMLDISIKRACDKTMIERAAVLYNLSKNLNKKLK